jgi:polyisoprenoid-binding protein YceI
MSSINKKIYYLIIIFITYITLISKFTFSENTKDIDIFENYLVDPFHSVVMFEIKNYVQLGNIVVGRFNKIEGIVNINKKDFTKSNANIKIYVNSLDTGWKERDEHLLGPNFFDVKNYLLITFQSKNIKLLTNNEFILNGDLTLL